MDLGALTQPYKGTRDDLERLAFDIQTITASFMGMPSTCITRETLATKLRVRMQEEVMGGYIQPWEEKYEIVVELDADPTLWRVEVRERKNQR